MINIGFVMDPIESINIKKDTSFAMMLAAAKRDWNIHYMNLNDLYIINGTARACTKIISVTDNSDNWFTTKSTQDIALEKLDVIIMRKDPPFDTEYIYATYILELAERKGSLIINKPQSLRDCNEKLFTTWFPHLTPQTLVSRNAKLIKEFHAKEKDIILKPLDGMGGASIFRIKENDPNLSVIIETLTNDGENFCMAQTFVPDISNGDKRILIVDGEPMPYCLARIPPKGETRGNIAAGGSGVARKLSTTDWKIANEIAPLLKEKGLIFVGLDIIGDKITEINVTSPTCTREIEAVFDISISDKLMDAIEKKLNHK